MDCIDCHNTVGHPIAPTAEQAVDRYIARTWVSRQLPFVRREAVRLMKASYPSSDAGAEAIGQRPAHPLRRRSAPADQQALTHTVNALQDLYRRNVFPTMKVTWGSYPDNRGHIDLERLLPLPRRLAQGQRRVDHQRRLRVLPQADRKPALTRSDRRTRSGIPDDLHPGGGARDRSICADSAGDAEIERFPAPPCGGVRGTCLAFQSSLPPEAGPGDVSHEQPPECSNDRVADHGGVLLLSVQPPIGAVRDDAGARDRVRPGGDGRRLAGRALLLRLLAVQPRRRRRRWTGSGRARSCRSARRRSASARCSSPRATPSSPASAASCRARAACSRWWAPPTSRRRTSRRRARRRSSARRRCSAWPAAPPASSSSAR